MFFRGLMDSKLACIPRGRLLAWLVALGVAGTVSAAQNSRAENAFHRDQQGHFGREHRVEIEADLTTDPEHKAEWLEDQQPSQALPIISLQEGWNFNRALSMPNWFELNASILSQNNASFSSPQVQPTSSNLFNLGFRLMPLKAVSNLSLSSKNRVCMNSTFVNLLNRRLLSTLFLRSVQVRSFRHRFRISSTHSGILARPDRTAQLFEFGISSGGESSLWSN